MSRQNKERKSDYMRNLRSHPEVYKPFLIIVFVSVLQQFSGVSVIRAYSVAIFDTVFSSNTSTIFTPASHNTSSGSVFSSNVTVRVVGRVSGATCHHTSSMAYIAAIVIGVCRSAILMLQAISIK